MRRAAPCSRSFSPAPRRRPAPLQLERLEDRTVPSAATELDLVGNVAQIPSDPSFSSQWALQNTGQSGGKPGADVSAVNAWEKTTGSRDVTVAVLDTGIDYRHPDLYLNIWINQGEIPASRRANLVDIDGDGILTFYDLNNPINQGVGKITDLNGNGRIDAGDLLFAMVKDSAGRDTGLGGWADGLSNDGDAYIDDIVGWNFVANNNNPFDDHGHGTHIAGTIGAVGDDGSGVAGLNWQVQLLAVKFINSSGSGTLTRFNAALQYAVAKGAQISNVSWTISGASQAMHNAVLAAQAAGHIVVAAAGNGSANNDSNGVFPANLSYDNVLAVAATDRYDNLAGYSNFGSSTVHLAAPGSDILSTGLNGGLSTRTGTSMATPFVAGTLALVWSQHPDWTYDQVIARVLATVDPLPSLQGKVLTGGRVNAAAAVGWTEAVAAPSPVPTPAPAPVLLPPPLLVQSQFSGAAFNTIDRVEVRFDQAIDPASLAGNDLVLTRPDGQKVTALSVSTLATGDQTRFVFVLPVQAMFGTYQVTIGPMIAGSTGVVMTAPYATSFTIEPILRGRSTAPTALKRGTAKSGIVIDQDLTIDRVTVQVNIAFPATEHLTLYLVAPDGTVLRLAANQGPGANYTATFFDDLAPRSIALGQAPFSGAFQPLAPLSSLAGKNARGLWQLYVQSSSANLTGTLLDWELTIHGK
jgi:subtilisin family serine protease/subtilisin-like proprotein convertase family protein